MPQKRLMTPGPTQVPEPARLAMARQVIRHRTSEFRAVLAEVLEGLKYVFCTDGRAFLKRLESRFGVKLAGGQQELEGKIFRMAHFGMVDELDIIATLAAIELVLD
jgi:aspartate aminotransferase-like enzyme